MAQVFQPTFENMSIPLLPHTSLLSPVYSKGKIMPQKTNQTIGCSPAGWALASLAKSFHPKGLHVFATLRSRSNSGPRSEIVGITGALASSQSHRPNPSNHAWKLLRDDGRLAYRAGQQRSERNFVMLLLELAIDDAKKVYNEKVYNLNV